MTKLTHDLLIRLGFHGEGKDLTNKPSFRLKIPVNAKGHHYHYQLQIVLNDYPEDNGNSGILSLYDPPVKDAHMLSEEDENCKVDFVMWQSDDRGDGQPSKGGIKYIDIREVNFPIAWHVTTLERLNDIYTSLTGNGPLVPRPDLTSTI